MFTKYTEFDIDIPDTLKNVRVTKLQLPYHMKKNCEERVLLVFDSVNNSDYAKKKMLSGLLGTFFETVDRESKKMCKVSMFDNNLFTINLNYVSMTNTGDDADTEDDESDEVKNQETLIEDLNKKRILEFCRKLKPTRIVTLGKRSFQIFHQLATEQYLYNATWTNLQGVPFDVKIGKHDCKVVPLLNPNWLCTYQDSRDPYLIGYFIRTWANAMVGHLRYDMDVSPDKIKIQYVDTIKKFDKMLKYLYEAKRVAIDTEADNLNRIANRMVIIQFSVTKKNAFVLPLYHYETPFNKKELQYIKEQLKKYFISNENEVHLYANANFDIPLIRKTFEFPFYPTEVWDVQAGEYGLDENIHELASVCGDNHGYYGLGNLCIQYGFHGYISGKFGKEDRSGISKSSLSTPGLINYCFAPSTLVHCENGVFTIKDIVEGNVNHGNILSYNHDTKSLEYQELLNVSVHDTEEDMYEIEYDGGTVQLTGNHKVWCTNRNKYTRVDELTENDEFLLYQP